MKITPDSVNPFYPFAAGPSDFVEPTRWLTELVTPGTLTGKLPLGIISNASISVPASEFNSEVTLDTLTLTRNAAGVSVGLTLDLSVGGQALPTFSLPLIRAEILDGSILTSVHTFTLGGTSSILKLELNSAYLRLFLGVAIPDDTAYTANHSLVFLQGTVKARPYNAVALTAVSPSAKGLRYKADPSPIRVPLGTSYPVEVAEGYNVDLTLSDDASVELAASPGGGIGAYPICPDEFIENAPQGITPVRGNMSIVGDGCHPTVMVHADTDPDDTWRLMVFGNCEACCSCQDFLNVLQAIKKIGITWTEEWDKLDAQKKNYDFTATKYMEAVQKISVLSLKQDLNLVVDRYNPDSATDYTGVMQMHYQLSLHDPSYAEEDLRPLYSENEPVLHIKEVTIQEIKITQTFGKSFTANPLNKPWAATMPGYLASAAPTVSYTGQVKGPFAPIPLRISYGDFDATFPNRSIILLTPLNPITFQLKPWATLKLDLVAYLGDVQIANEPISVDVKWGMGIYPASNANNPWYDPNIILADPKQTGMQVVPLYVSPEAG